MIISGLGKCVFLLAPLHPPPATGRRVWVCWGRKFVLGGKVMTSGAGSIHCSVGFSSCVCLTTLLSSACHNSLH